MVEMTQASSIVTATPPSIWQRIDRGFAIAVRCIELSLSVAFVFVVVLNFVTAADRYLFKRSIIGSDEVQIYVMIWMTFVGAAVVTWRHQHLRMDVLVSRFPPRARVALLWLELALVLVLMIVLMSHSIKYATFMQLIDRRSDLASLPMWIPHAALAVGFGLIGLITLWRIVELAAGRAETDERPSGAELGDGR
jgi:TRAP-type C4-dicarboxylate transport system permease small subunit